MNIDQHYVRRLASATLELCFSEDQSYVKSQLSLDVIEQCIINFEICVGSPFAEDWMYVKYAGFLFQLDFFGYGQKIIELCQAAVKKYENPHAFHLWCLCLISLYRNSEAETLIESWFDLLKEKIQDENKLSITAAAINKLIEKLCSEGNFEKARSIIRKYIEKCEGLDEKKIIESFHKSDLSSFLNFIDSHQVSKKYDKVIQQLRWIYLVKKYESHGVVDFESSEMSQIIANISKLVAIRVNYSKKKYVIYCLNSAYLPGFFVSIFSFVINNKAILHNLKFFVFYDGSFTGEQINRIKEFKKRYRLNLKVYDVRGIVEKSVTDKLRTDYQQSSATLDVSAYYRIYAIKYLLDSDSDLKNVDRFLYLDCDTIIVSNLIEFFGFGFEQPLAAVHDRAVGSITHAMTQNKLSSYFNSGVLLFNSHHQELKDFIEDTIAHSVFNQGALFFQDQCALNLAFKNSWYRLPEIYNNFELESETCRIHHFIEKPKVWEPDYFEQNELGHSSYSKLWFLYNNYLSLIGFGEKKTQISIKQRLGGVGVAFDKVRRRAGIKAIFLYLRKLFLITVRSSVFEV